MSEYNQTHITETEVISFMGIAKLLLSKIVLILLVVVSATVLGVVGTLVLKTESYKSSATFLVVFNDDTLSSYADLKNSKILIEQCAQIITSDNVLNAVLNTLQIDNVSGYESLTIESMKCRTVSISQIGATQSFTVSVTADNPLLSESILRSILNEATDEILIIVGAEYIKTISESNGNNEMIKPSVVKNAAFCGAMSCLFVVGIIIFVGICDTRVKSEDDVISTGMQLLGVIQHIGE